MVEKGPEESNARLQAETGRRGTVALFLVCDNCSPVPELNVQTTHETFSSWRKICKWRETRGVNLSLLELCKCPLNEEENGKCLVQRKGGKSDGVCRDGWGERYRLGCAVVLVTILPVNPSPPPHPPMPHAGEEQAFLFVRRVISLGLCALRQRATLAEAAGKRNIRTQGKTSFAFYWGGFAGKGEGSRQSPSFRPAVLGLVLK
ncbi:hypothetical protein KIL84_008750 [Mauremys mutica]|uniref:Uncharacterized protein n=1 Tax=Mauremys mutica TaxID=74926 RepID=A0A9D3X3H0_9SAUR|nr:hypothetical protein KIL84_008750 [Mauremys mutica]